MFHRDKNMCIHKQKRNEINTRLQNSTTVPRGQQSSIPSHSVRRHGLEWDFLSLKRLFQVWSLTLWGGRGRRLAAAANKKRIWREFLDWPQEPEQVCGGLRQAQSITLNGANLIRCHNREFSSGISASKISRGATKVRSKPWQEVASWYFKQICIVLLSHLAFGTHVDIKRSSDSSLGIWHCSLFYFTTQYSVWVETVQPHRQISN